MEASIVLQPFLLTATTSLRKGRANFSQRAIAVMHNHKGNNVESAFLKCHITYSSSRRQLAITNEMLLLRGRQKSTLARRLTLLPYMGDRASI